MKKFNVIMNGTPLNDYEMDEIFGGETNINCQNAVLGCCLSNHTTGCGKTNPSDCIPLNSIKLCYEPVNPFPCYLNACDPPPVIA